MGADVMCAALRTRAVRQYQLELVWGKRLQGCHSTGFLGILRRFLLEAKHSLAVYSGAVLLASSSVSEGSALGWVSPLAGMSGSCSTSQSLTTPSLPISLFLKSVPSCPVCCNPRLLFMSSQFLFSSSWFVKGIILNYRSTVSTLFPESASGFIEVLGR